jgi:hypothetical protein
MRANGLRGVLRSRLSLNLGKRALSPQRECTWFVSQILAVQAFLLVPVQAFLFVAVQAFLFVAVQAFLFVEHQ